MVGSGAGGGAAARVLADAGWRVLVVERGEPLRDPRSFQDERRMLLERAASDDRPLRVNGRPGRLYVGGVPGGGTALYGAALLRPGRSDFAPGRHYGHRLPRHLWEWPVSYDELAPWYDQAEDLFRVSGDCRVRPPHLEWRTHRYAAPAAELAPRNARLAADLEAQGTRPFPLPLAIDASTCLRCAACPGYRCPTGARTSTWDHVLLPLAEQGALEVWTGCEADRIPIAGREAVGLRLTERASGRVVEVRARQVLVAAGALGTPVLLQRSGVPDASGQLGRNHMCHLGAVAAALFREPTGGDRTFLKQLGLSDYYLGTPDFPHKLGYAQSVPVPGPLSLRQHLRLPLPLSWARRLHAHALLLAGSVEDLPRPSNRVAPRGERGARLERRFHRYDVVRGRWLARRLARLLRGAGAAAALPVVASRDVLHAAHQVGTCRFGRDPLRSVCDPLGRVHGLDNVTVVDGSLLPTSLGVGPALTIAANALRIATALTKEAA